MLVYLLVKSLERELLASAPITRRLCMPKWYWRLYDFLVGAVLTLIASAIFFTLAALVSNR